MHETKLVEKEVNNLYKINRIFLLKNYYSLLSNFFLKLSYEIFSSILLSKLFIGLI